MSLSSIRKKALAGSLEVEHLLREAKLATPGLGKLLLQLSNQLGWSSPGLCPDGSRQVPFAAWASVVAAYSDAGLSGLRSLAADPKLSPFAIGLLEELKTREALAFMLEAFASAMAEPEQNLDVAFRLAAALNLMLSFKPAAPIQKFESERVQAFLLKLHALARSEAEAAVALLGLRGVGSAEAIAFVQALPALSQPWAGVPSAVVRAIRKRLPRLPSNPSVKGTGLRPAPYVER